MYRQILSQSPLLSSWRQKPTPALLLHSNDVCHQRSRFCQAYPSLPEKTGERMYYFSVQRQVKFSPTLSSPVLSHRNVFEQQQLLQ